MRPYQSWVVHHNQKKVARRNTLTTRFNGGNSIPGFTIAMISTNKDGGDYMLGYSVAPNLPTALSEEYDSVSKQLKRNLFCYTLGKLHRIS